MEWDGQKEQKQWWANDFQLQMENDHCCQIFGWIFIIVLKWNYQNERQIILNLVKTARAGGYEAWTRHTLHDFFRSKNLWSQSMTLIWNPGIQPLWWQSCNEYSAVTLTTSCTSILILFQFPTGSWTLPGSRSSSGSLTPEEDACMQLHKVWKSTESWAAQFVHWALII